MQREIKKVTVKTFLDAARFYIGIVFATRYFSLPLARREPVASRETTALPTGLAIIVQSWPVY